MDLNTFLLSILMCVLSFIICFSVLGILWVKDSAERLLKSFRTVFTLAEKKDILEFLTLAKSEIQKLKEPVLPTTSDQVESCLPSQSEMMSMAYEIDKLRIPCLCKQFVFSLDSKEQKKESHTDDMNSQKNHLKEDPLYEAAFVDHTDTDDENEETTTYLRVHCKATNEWCQFQYDAKNHTLTLAIDVKIPAVLKNTEEDDCTTRGQPMAFSSIEKVVGLLHAGSQIA